MHQDILQQAAAVFGLSLADLVGPSRQRHIAEARQAAAYALRRRTSLSLAAVGELLGGRDYTTILHAARAAEQRAVVNPTYASQLAALAHGGA